MVLETDDAGAWHGAGDQRCRSVAWCWRPTMQTPGMVQSRWATVMRLSQQCRQAGLTGANPNLQPRLT